MTGKNSPYIATIFNQYHKNQLRYEIRRRTLSSTPHCNGIMKTKLLINQFYSSYMIEDTITTLIRNCIKCKIRTKSYMTSPVAPIHQNNLMSKSPLEVWKIDILGPITTIDKKKATYLLESVP